MSFLTFIYLLQTVQYFANTTFCCLGILMLICRSSVYILDMITLQDIYIYIYLKCFFLACDFIVIS